MLGGIICPDIILYASIDWFEVVTSVYVAFFSNNVGYEDCYIDYNYFDVEDFPAKF